MISGSSKVILAKWGWEQVLLWASPGICSKYTLYFSWISKNSEKDKRMMLLLIIDAFPLIVEFNLEIFRNF